MPSEALRHAGLQQATSPALSHALIEGMAPSSTVLGAVICPHHVSVPHQPGLVSYRTSAIGWHENVPVPLWKQLALIQHGGFSALLMTDTRWIATQFLSIDSES